jgi:aminoglycoside 2'-N-acetyltransferase I
LNTDLSKQAEFTLKELLSDAFEGDFSEEDWQHTFGGMRFLGHHKDQLIAHGAVVKRWMQVDGLKTLVGYVEGIAQGIRITSNGGVNVLLQKRISTLDALNG